MVSPNYGENNQIRELESLQRIVDRTAGILIDIPSTLHLERLEQQEAQTRSKEYISALNTVKIPEQTIRKLYTMTSIHTGHMAGGELHVPGGDGSSHGGSASSSVKAPSVRDVLAEKAIDAKTLGWMANAMGELQQAAEQIDVEDVGNLIVTLSPPLTK
ncbi:hypothetical protein BGZ94_008941 [Podila epigama]|nr:hypothetical protein BGZ94_008941 [Podila epigama]